MARKPVRSKIAPETDTAGSGAKARMRVGVKPAALGGPKPPDTQAEKREKRRKQLRENQDFEAALRAGFTSVAEYRADMRARVKASREDKLAPATQGAVKGRVRTNIPFEDALDAVVDAVVANPDLARVVESRLAKHFARQAEEGASELGREDHDRIAALWAAEIAKPKNDPTRRRAGPFIKDALAPELSAGLDRKSLPSKLKQAYAAWLSRYPDEEAVWPETDRKREQESLQGLSAEEVLERQKAQRTASQARYRARLGV